MGSLQHMGIIHPALTLNDHDPMRDDPDLLYLHNLMADSPGIRIQKGRFQPLADPFPIWLATAWSLNLKISLSRPKTQPFWPVYSICRLNLT